MRSALAILATLPLTVAGCGGSGSSGPPSSLSVAIGASTIAGGSSVQATATINGSPASSVSWSSSNTDVATVTSTGLISGFHKGSSVIRATSGGLTGSATVTVIPGAPALIFIISGNNQVSAKGATLPDPLCTSVTDAAGNAIIGAVVTHVVATGGGQLASPTAPTVNANGIAISGLWSLGSAAGAQTVVASSPGVGSVTFTATAQ
jgi:hypothetical protein